MTAKKRISVIALDPRAGISYRSDIARLFGEVADISVFSMLDGSASGVLDRADLFVASTDAYGSPEELMRHIPIDSQTMAVEVSFRWSELRKLKELPAGSRVLFVNMTQTMAREAIAQLEQFGITHIHWIPFYPGAPEVPGVRIAVTPDELRYVPRGMETVIDLGQRDELLHLYKQKDLSYQEVRDTAQEAMSRLIREMESGICDCPAIEEKLVTLAETLKDTNGKKVYGYLKKPVKAQVDDIVDELAQLPMVAECYELWNKLQTEMEGYYTDKPREHLPLSQQKEFKAIKNMVIREAERIRLGKISFEDEQMDDEQNDEDEVLDRQANWQMVNTYREARFILCDDDSTWAEQEKAVYMLEQLWNDGFTAVAHQLGKCWRDGLGVLPDDDKAELWFRRSAEAGNDASQYALGKFLQNRKRVEEAVGWYEKAAKQSNQYANYRLGKLYLLGDGVPKDMEKAIAHLTRAAKSGNQYAQYVLGKLYLDRQDQVRARYWFTQSATQGNEYAQFFLDRWDNLKPPSIMLSVTRLLHHMGRIFQEQMPGSTVPGGVQIDRKRLAQLREKKIAMGHKADDHEEPTQSPTMTMG